MCGGRQEQAILSTVQAGVDALNTTIHLQTLFFFPGIYYIGITKQNQPILRDIVGSFLSRRKKSENPFSQTQEMESGLFLVVTNLFFVGGGVFGAEIARDFTKGSVDSFSPDFIAIFTDQLKSKGFVVFQLVAQ